MIEKKEIRFIAMIHALKFRVPGNLYLMFVAAMHKVMMNSQTINSKEKLIGVTKTKLKVINDHQFFKQTTIYKPLAEQL